MLLWVIKKYDYTLGTRKFKNYCGDSFFPILTGEKPLKRQRSLT